MILGSRQGISRLEPVASLDIGDGHVEVRDEIKILGVHLDPTLSMNAQVKSLMKTSNFHIRALRHIRQGLTFESAEMIALGLVTSRLDYCNSLLYGTLKANIGRLQRVQYDLARVVLQAAWNFSSKPLLKHLHWLSVQQRIIFKIALVTFNVRTFKQCELSNSHFHSLLDNYIPSRNLRWGQKDNIFSEFLSGNQLLPDAASPSRRRPSGTALTHHHGKQPVSKHSRHVSRPNCFSRPFSEHPPSPSLASYLRATWPCD